MSALDLPFSVDSSPESNSTYLHQLASAAAFDQQTSPESSHLTSDSATGRSNVSVNAQQGQSTSSSSERRKSGRRKKTFTREDRAMHSVVERQRRGAFNQLLNQLASNIPDQLPTTKQHSKNIIIRASIAHHAEQRQRALVASGEIRKLLAERSELLCEINDLRTRLTQAGPRTLDRTEERAREKDRTLVFNVETESFAAPSTSLLFDSREMMLEAQGMALHTSGNRMPQTDTLPIDANYGEALTPSQVTRLLQHIDDDLLRIAPM